MGEDVRELELGNLELIPPENNPKNTFHFDPKKKQIFLIDQYEELFTECTKNEQEALEIAFLKLFEASLSGKLIIIMTIRSDFEWQLELSSFGQKFLIPTADYYAGIQLYRLSALGLDDLRSALVNPAHLLVYEFEKDEEGDLADTILEDLNYLPNALPLLSFTMQELVIETNEQERIFKREVYRDTIGGVSGVLSKKIDSIYQGLGQVSSNNDQTGAFNPHQWMMKNIILRMVSLSDGEYTRRRVMRDSKLDEFGYEKNQEILALIIKKLGEALLISQGGEGHQPYIELIHDSLINTWTMGKQWINDFGKDNLLLQTPTLASSRRVS